MVSGEDGVPEPVTDSSSELVLRASKGSTPAVDELLALNLPALRTFVRLRTGRRIRLKESCSDLVQSVCREILEDMSDFEYRGAKAFRHWLFTAALRKILDRDRFYRKEKRDAARDASPRGDGDLAALYRHVFTASRAAVAREDIARFEEAFDELSDIQREIITLVRLVGLDYSEVAERLGRSEASCRTELSRGMARIAMRLQ